ncbi:pseudaminic acid cytidylyltransferase [Desulfonatronovibrio hydrogenovorans]|uniref:pseudaminic acid cytidylyltransferase n=1 Tax=Desulfonatronovibrio hydrogenovorans TaxID=53245 RepID=UPI00048C12CC|nr:pseudaminic acid cytidylyltransferase [Desulfonatronovibrio hydrogenovorans]
MNCIALIPARGGSKRLPGKNIKSVMGKPMIAYPISTALQSKVFERVLVSTEDNEIADISTKCGAEVVPRPSELATDQATVHQVVRHTLASLERAGELPGCFCIIYPTAILLEPRHLVESHALLSTRNVDCVLAIQKFKPHPFKALSYEKNVLFPAFPEHFTKKGQQLPSFFAPAGAFHWMRSQAFLDAQGPVWTMSRSGYILKSYEAIDIDEHEDLAMAERLLIAKTDVR